MHDVARWLERHGLAQYAQVFEEKEITLTDLPQRAHDVLREFGMPMGWRRRFLSAVAAWDLLDAVASALNSRPRKTLRWKTSSEALDD